jgi:uncharacterized protein with ParB-like and HNH nuclease domain
MFEKEANTELIIDGQQRLTTVVLFFAALAKILEDNGKDENKTRCR